MRKSILISFSFLFFSIVACQQDQPMQFSYYDKLSIQNDTNWVEVTDIDTIITNIYPVVYKDGKVATNENQYKEYFNENKKYFKSSDSTKYSKYFKYQSPNIDFNKRDLILYMNMTGTVQKVERNLYLNIKSNEIRYLLKIYSKYSPNSVVPLRGDGFIDQITVPKYDKVIIKFDTLWIWP